MPIPSLPPEILDSIIDLLRDEPETLKECCLVAKSWIPCTRKHLFADIQFSSIDDLRLWKKTFPDSANSPAHHTRTLFISCAEADVAVNEGENGWIQAFSGVTSLGLDSYSGFIGPQVSLIPFHKFSPTLKSLHAHSLLLPFPQLFTFVLSYPLLEDLTVAGVDFGGDNDNDDIHESSAAIPSTPPPLAGTLHLEIARGIGNTVRRLLGLPTGLHFRKLVFWWSHAKDFPWIMELLIRCSNSLECLDVMCNVPFDLEPEASIDLSKATRLKTVALRIKSWSFSVGWIDMALRTIVPEHRHLSEISIHVSSSFEGSDIRRAMGEAAFGRWLDLDHVLVQLWESHSIRPRIEWKQYDTESGLAYLLPEAVKRGIIDPI